jgi:hypothetical protein
MKMIIAKKNDAYGVLVLGAIAGVFSLHYLLSIKSSGDLFLFLLLGSISSFFIFNAFKTGSLTYDTDVVTIKTFNLQYDVLFPNILSIVREPATAGYYSYGYKLRFLTETDEKKYVIVFVPWGKVKDIKVLASLIKLKNPTFEFDNKMSD